MKRFALMLLLAAPAFGGQLFVTNVSDIGAGSLRQALYDAQIRGVCSKPCEIVFNISGPLPASGYWTIEPLSPLPEIFTDGIIVDGATQTAFSGDTNPDGPEVVLSGAMAGRWTNGLVFRAIPNAGYLGASVTRIGFVNWDGTALVFLGTPYPLPFGFPTSLATPIRNVTIGGNYVGIDGHGLVPQPNATGVMLWKCEDCRVAGNIVTGNRYSGILALGSRIQIRNNTVGMDAGQGKVFGNGDYGIGVSEGYNIRILGNVIEGHNVTAVAVEYLSEGVFISGNTMRWNGFGIDLWPFGSTPNDSGDLDIGPNGLQNYPVLTLQNGNLTGDLDSTPNTDFLVEIYETDLPTKNQGTRYLTSAKVTTNAAGLANFLVSLPPGAGPYITATATDLTTLSTSEFCTPVP